MIEETAIMIGRYFQRVLLHVLNALTWTISVMHADTKERGDNTATTNTRIRREKEITGKQIQQN